MKINAFICRILIAVGLVWQAHSAVAQTDNYDLYVSYTDSVEVAIDLANLRTLTFSYSDRTMTANYRDGGSYTHDYSRIGKMYFAVADGIGQVETDSPALYRLDGVQLTLHEEVRSATLYRLDGTLVMNITGREVWLGELPKGIYILRVDNQIAKLCVR